MANQITARTAKETREFYDGLVTGQVSRGLWGKQQRFDPAAIVRRRSVQRHFVRTMQNYLTKEDVVLDLGCGPGGFMMAVAPLCRRIVGADITPRFVELSSAAIAESGIDNAEAQLIVPGRLPYADASFDKILMVDTHPPSRKRLRPETIG